MFLAAGLSADNDLSIRGTVALLAEEPGWWSFMLRSESREISVV